MINKRRNLLHNLHVSNMNFQSLLNKSLQCSSKIHGCSFHVMFACVFFLYFHFSLFWRWFRQEEVYFFKWKDVKRCCSHFICIEMLFARFNSLLVSLLLSSFPFHSLPFDFLFPFLPVIWKVCLCNGFVIKGAFFYIAMQCLFMKCC